MGVCVLPPPPPPPPQALKGAPCARGKHPRYTRAAPCSPAAGRDTHNECAPAAPEGRAHGGHSPVAVRARAPARPPPPPPPHRWRAVYKPLAFQEPPAMKRGLRAWTSGARTLTVRTARAERAAEPSSRERCVLSCAPGCQSSPGMRVGSDPHDRTIARSHDPKIPRSQDPNIGSEVGSKMSH